MNIIQNVVSSGKSVHVAMVAIEEITKIFTIELEKSMIKESELKNSVKEYFRLFDEILERSTFMYDVNHEQKALEEAENRLRELVGIS